MDNAEEVLQCLDEFLRMRPKDIPRELEDYLCYVAKTGDPIYQWPMIKQLFRDKFVRVMTDFYESCRSQEIPHYPNVDPFNYDSMKRFILEKLDSFHSAPFTIQRICELLTTPRKEYNRIDKYMRALEKNVLVISTREPGPLRKLNDSGGESLLNGIENPNDSLSINDAHMEIDHHSGPLWEQDKTVSDDQNHLNSIHHINDQHHINEHHINDQHRINDEEPLINDEEEHHMNEEEHHMNEEEHHNNDQEEHRNEQCHLDEQQIDEQEVQQTMNMEEQAMSEEEQTMNDDNEDQLNNEQALNEEEMCEQSINVKDIAISQLNDEVQAQKELDVIEQQQTQIIEQSEEVLLESATLIEDANAQQELVQSTNDSYDDKNLWETENKSSSEVDTSSETTQDSIQNENSSSSSSETSTEGITSSNENTVIACNFDDKERQIEEEAQIEESELSVAKTDEQFTLDNICEVSFEQISKEFKQDETTAESEDDDDDKNEKKLDEIIVSNTCEEKLEELVEVRSFQDDSSNNKEIINDTLENSNETVVEKNETAKNVDDDEKSPDEIFEEPTN